MSGRFAKTPEALLYSGVSAVALQLWAVLDRHANRRREAWPSHERLAELMGCSVSTVQRAQRELVRVGCLGVKTRNTGHGRQSSLYRLLDPPSRLVTGDRSGTTSPPVKSAEPTGQERPGPPITSDRQNESQENESQGNENTHTARESEDDLNDLQEEAVFEGEVVNGEVVDEPAELLALFNELAGTRHRPAGRPRTLIQARMREHPDLALADHQGLVRLVFEHPWWDGPPGPGVVWEQEQFEKAMTRLRGGYARKLSRSEQVERHSDRLRQWARQRAAKEAGS
jgi:hypothetical protein